MTKEGSKQGKIKQYLLASFRILNKARQLYMKGVVECAGGHGHGYGGAGVGVGPLSPSLQHIISLPKTSGDEGQVKNVENEKRVVVHRQRQQQPFVGYGYNRRRMSYNTEVRKIGRIEEDQPCCFEEDQMDVKTHLLHLYPRRRSNALPMRIEG